MPGTSGKGGTKSEKRAHVSGSGPGPGADDPAPSPRQRARARAAPPGPGDRPSSGPPGRAEPTRVGTSAFGAVVVDPLPLFRAGTVAALRSGGVPVLGEAAHLGSGIQLAEESGAQVMLLGGANAEEAREAVDRLPGCAVVVLLGQPTREELVELLGTGVAGFAQRSLTPEELLATVEEAALKLGAPEVTAPVFVPVLVGAPSLSAPHVPAEDLLLTPKEREILAQLARGASNKRIAEALFVTPATVKTHLAHIYAKLGARGRHEAVTQAMAMGIVR